ncbi:type II secretion system protein GspM [Caulobacter soli]|uniref:type II secretion system protein GspM n=1 Tax=Caulobacter soli TaxID=2708539 RepID=UPI0013EBDCE7|nr:type II secretion system protein GspM [Caulobacter soli]
MKPLSPRERRLVAVGVLAGLVGLAWLGLVRPVLNGFEARDERRAAALARHERDQRLLASLPAVRATLAEQRRSGRLYRITAPDEAAAVEALKQRLVAELTQAGGTVSAAEAVRADVPPGWVSVRADATMTLTQLNASLRQIENDTPYVVVDYASIDAEQSIRTSRPGPLGVRLQISARHAVAPVR